jgi:hypothetical protein
MPHHRFTATTVARPFGTPPPRRHPATLSTGWRFYVLAFACRRDLGNSIFQQIASCLVDSREVDGVFMRNHSSVTYQWVPSRDNACIGLLGLRAAFELKQNKTKTTPQGRGNRAPVSAGQRAPFSTISANPSEVL